MSAASPSFSGPYSADHEPTARIIRSGDGCFAVVEVDVSGTVDEVWESVATGPGYRRWFGEAEIEEQVGGPIVTHHTDFGASTGTITVWEPPHRYVYAEADWRGDGTPVPAWTTEITVHRLFPTEPGSGPGPGLARRPGQGPDDGSAHTRVRLTSGVETEGERWGQDIEETLPGWSAALRLLGEHHAHAPGLPDDEALG